MYQTISIALEKSNGCDNIARRKTRWPIRADRADVDGGKDIIVIHLKCGIPHNLEPVDHCLDGGKQIEVCICSDLLFSGNVITLPTE